MRCATEVGDNRFVVICVIIPRIYLAIPRKSSIILLNKRRTLTRAKRITENGLLCEDYAGVAVGIIIT